MSEGHDRTHATGDAALDAALARLAAAVGGLDDVAARLLDESARALAVTTRTMMELEGIIARAGAPEVRAPAVAPSGRGPDAETAAQISSSRTLPASTS